MSKVDILLGLQWGDEGKGKVVDFLAPQYDVVARFQGGPNAGHTLEFEGIKHVLHQIPSGIFHEGILNVIGNGVVLDPITFSKEIDQLGKFNLKLTDSLVISTRAQMIVPTHRLLDEAQEISKGEKKIGSTLRGIGPTYQDKMARVGLRIGDILSPDFNERYEKLKERHFRALDNLQFDYADRMPELDEQFFKAVEVLKSFRIVNTEYLVNEKLNQGKKVLAEGAQGSLLDIDFGSYPYVTSSNTISAGACSGLGVAPSRIGEVYGIFKAYCTRVGSGPFPTELHGDDGEELRKIGHEFGATTGRPRRCGWLDIPALNYATMLNGVTQLFMMKVDVLSNLSEIKLCEKYKIGGEMTREFPVNIDDNLVPSWKTFGSWSGNSFKNYSELPQQLSDYIAYIEDQLNVPINLISFGPDRVQTLMKEKIF